MARGMRQQFTCQERLDALRAAKLAHTREKQRVIGAMDHDDWGIILPPPECRKLVQATSGSGVLINDALLKGYEPQSNHPSGGFFGPKACGANFRAFLEEHPVYLDPVGSLAGASMVNFSSYRRVGWNPDIDFSPLAEDFRKYHVGGIGATQHFCQDFRMGLEVGWGGILEKIRYHRQLNAPRADDFYQGLEDLVLGMRNWIGRHAEAAREKAKTEPNPQLRQNLREIADMNEWLVAQPPRTFREACQWMLWHLMAARMYNGSGSLGRLDVLLLPYYGRESAEGKLTDEEAILHIAGLLLRDTAYIQLGGPDAAGRDVTNPVSFLVLEAAHRLKIPANIGVCVGEGTDPRLFRRGVEILLEDKMGIPKFLGIDNTTHGFMRNGYPAELARERAYSGCHWSAIPGREYCLNDCIKINFGRILEIALDEMRADKEAEPSIASLWDRFEFHLKRAVEVVIEGVAFHLQHMHEVFPELVLDLLCSGPVEKGRDASNWGVEYYNICLDGSALATVADSFAAMEQRIEREQRLSWVELHQHLSSNWAGSEGERVRLMMRSIPRYGRGGTCADEWAVRISQTFSRLVTETPTPGSFRMIPGLFSWAATISMGRSLGATPNGRYAGAPISHGANPDPGFREDGAPTAMAVAIASVQPGFGNTAPMQIEVDPFVARDRNAVDMVANLIKTHFDLGGTQVNINVLDRERLLEANEDPSKYPDLVVRVTGFSAYFASLSPEFRQLVVDRMVAAE